jgi:hypothetical protein
MSCVKNVIQTADVFAAALDNVNRESALELMHQVMQLTEAANFQTNQTLSTQITTVRNDLQIAINTVSVKTEQALAAATILEGAEVDQLIQAFKDFIGTAGMQQLLQDSMVTICGKQYQLNSVLETLARADRDAKVELLYNACGDELVGVRYTLTDDTVITLHAAVSFDDRTGLKMYDFSTADWRGLPASYNCTYRRMQSALTFFGKTISSVKFLPISHTNLVFSLCEKFVPEAPNSAAKLVPDLSNLTDANHAAAASAAAGAAHASASVASSSSSSSSASASAAASSSTTVTESSVASSSDTTTTTTTSSSTSHKGNEGEQGK